MDYLNAFDAILLARIQFAFTIAFHIIFPAISIGLASFLAVLEGAWLLTKKQVYLNLFHYWLKPFALVFGMGVVSGVVLSYQFGTNWSVFADITGPVLGPLMGYEVLTAFFLEAGFLGVMLFGLNRVGPRAHFFATLMVAVGTLISAFWILSVNSWMQTPAGYAINEQGQFIPKDWWAIVFNPSFPFRLVHMTMAAWLSTSFMVAAASAWHLLRGKASLELRTAFSMAMWMAALVAPLQVIAGDLHGLNTLEHQPLKVAAMEGHFETVRGAPFIVFGLPDEDAGVTRAALKIPKVGSLILTHDLNGEVKGLKAWPKEEWPNVPVVFWSFRIMVGLGVLMVLTGIVSLRLRYKKTLYNSPLFQRACIAMGPSGLIALLAGWVVTEVGRQPYTVYGLLRTADSASPIAAAAVGASLIAFVVTYCFVFGAGIYYLFRTLSKVPSEDASVHADSHEDPISSTHVLGGVQAERSISKGAY